MASLIFTERFMMLMRDRQLTFEKLEMAYGELENVASLKQIGESTAIINHEIKNYMFKISGMADLIKNKERLSEKGSRWIESIINSIDGLNKFSMDILDLSKRKIIKDKKEICINKLIQDCVSRYFTDEQEVFLFEGFERDNLIFGDWNKLEQVFLNILKNSFEAASAEPLKIKIKLVAAAGILLLVIEDNGQGCTLEQIEGIFKAFYTTKDKKQGTGLGMSITRTIIESHGGRISAYSKNLEKNGEHGLELHIVFPVYSEHEGQEDDKKNILLIKEGIESLDVLLRVFQNVRVKPYILQEAQELDRKDYPVGNLKILGTAESIKKISDLHSGYKKLFLLSYHGKVLYALEKDAKNIPEVFSEEFIISRLL
jgi:signal transduction histidine kinase